MSEICSRQGSSEGCRASRNPGAGWVPGAGCKMSHVSVAVSSVSGCHSPGVPCFGCWVLGAGSVMSLLAGPGCRESYRLTVPFLRVTLGHPVISLRSDRRQRRRGRRDREPRESDGSQSDTTLPSDTPPNDNTPNRRDTRSVRPDSPLGPG